MQPEQEEIIYNYFPELVRKCDLQEIADDLVKYDPSIKEYTSKLKNDEDKYHYNRCILFKLLQTKSSILFEEFVRAIRRRNLYDLANKLENKPVIKILHKTSCFEPANEEEDDDDDDNEDDSKEVLNYNHVGVPAEPLKVDITYATQWCDEEESARSECYSTRSKNRGRVLMINNISFNSLPRTGAEVDEDNLKVLFERMGFKVEMHRDLKSYEMKTVTETFAKDMPDETFDICVFIIMSHGKKVKNKTVILGVDEQGLEEDFFIEQFNNKNCLAFKHKPKIMFFHVCRGELVDGNLSRFNQHTQWDSACLKGPDGDKGPADERLYSDMIICHPSVDGHKAHRDTVRGCWYMELVCKVFMENAFKTHVENLLKLVDKNLARRISETKTRQTSTFENIAFKTCFLHPGIYEENGEMMTFKQSI